jgi:ribose/xylose/arabinose/galactoside ABC-type transport system permease subunit
MMQNLFKKFIIAFVASTLLGMIMGTIGTVMDISPIISSTITGSISGVIVVLLLNSGSRKHGKK